MIIGLVLGLALGIFGLFWLFYGSETDNWGIAITLIILSFIIPAFIGAEIGKYEDKIEYLQYVESYKAKKEIIEKEIKNKSIEELEKIGMFNNIVTINSDLAKAKIKYNRWNYYFLDKTKIEELKPIELGDK